ncbi:MAG: 2-oxoacid:ferredoxin oxidoreductase subunit beta [Candidatus Kerfeldbacteria bacterium]|nr:2-oxoacid:ferredoxin oxidoreductase subunit beta [Candidatus Kerfeldbacteria bacterium]
MAKPAPSPSKPFASQHPTWCPGCGDFGIWNALQRSLRRLKLKPDQVTFVFGIGCSGNMVNFIKAYGFHGLHGRPLPVAEGIRLANHRLPVIVVGGDGDGLGEGIGHFLHTARSNPNITYIIHDNQVYGLTKGQHSPTAERGFISPSAPLGVQEEPVNPVALALASGASFVSRGFAGDVAGLEELVVRGIQHEGFALVDALQPCVTYNWHNSYHWYYQRVYNLDSVGHDSKNFVAAWERAQENMAEKIPLGVFYARSRPTIESQQPALARRTLVEQQPSQPIDISKLLTPYQ